MASTGYLIVTAYASRARLPLKDVAVAVTAEDGTAIALRLTDENGKVAPIPIPVPERAESQSPNPLEQPFTQVNLAARLEDYESVLAQDIQIFADTTTNQNLELIPLSEYPNALDSQVNYRTPPQNL